MSGDPRRIIVDEAEWLEIKQLAADLRHALAKAKISEYVNPDRNRKPFTAEEKEQIQTLYESGVTVFHIAKKIGRRYNSVKNHINRNKKDKV